jgi:nicotinamidase-related amidase
MENIKEKTALLVMDFQSGIIDRLENKDEFLQNVNIVIDTAHKHHIQVIYVVVGFREGLPEISGNNKSFNTIKETGSSTMINSHPVIDLTSEDLLVTKHRVSAFSGSDLEMLLRAQNIKSLVLAGISTSGVVLSTLREAADKDFVLTVLSDLCNDFDEEVHSVLVNKVFPRQATVTTSEEWMKAQNDQN